MGRSAIAVRENTKVLHGLGEANFMTDFSGSLGPAKTGKSATTGSRDQIGLIFVDDDDDFREAASSELEDLGFQVASFSDGAAMLAAVGEGLTADVVVLDWFMPAMMGIDVLVRLRREGNRTPVVFLTGHSTPGLEDLAFEQGATDFVDKAWGIPVLAKRLQPLIESSTEPGQRPADGMLHLGRLQLRPRDDRAFWDETDVDLTPVEFAIVRLLASNMDNQVGFREIYDCMQRAGFLTRSSAEASRENVRSSIKWIWNKFRSVDALFDEIESHPSYGYRWKSSRRR
jgi:two-component system, OmpR family, response regulator ChvI